MGRNSVRSYDNIEGRGFSKKRMPICNGLDRGSNFASIRKDADLLKVFSCVNWNKPANVRYSTTPIGERLTDSYVSGLLSGITKSVKTTDARYRKGLKSLEPYEGKLSSTVPRRGRAGNCFLLSDTIVRIVKQNERKQVDTLKPKGMESGYNGSADIMANGQMIPGLQMASKVFTLFAVWNLVNPICSLYLKKKR